MSSTRQDRFVRLAQVVGDFGNPFYAEERQRDVWNEASAFGLQLAIWTALPVCTVTVWLVGAPALPYVCVAMALTGLVCGATMAYAQRLGVTLTGRDRLLRWRMVPYLLLVVVFAAGLLRAEQDELSPSLAAGIVTGALLPLLLFLRLARSSSSPG